MRCWLVSGASHKDHSGFYGSEYGHKKFTTARANTALARLLKLHSSVPPKGASPHSFVTLEFQSLLMSCNSMAMEFHSPGIPEPPHVM